MTTTTRFTTPFTRATTAAEVLAGVDLTGRRAIITGAASGIGAETARALAAAGAEVTLAVRNPEARAKVVDEIIAATGNEAVFGVPFELTDLSSVRALAESWHGPLHILVNNAGVMALPELQRTQTGWETHFAANHLGHFALAVGLHAALAAAGDARVVALSSDAHAYANSPVAFDDIHFERREYNGHLAYAQSKTANVLFAVEAGKRWAADGIVVNAVHPGGIQTGLQRHMNAGLPADVLEQLATAWPWRSVEQGAATSVLAAASPLLHGTTGRYLENCNEAVPYDPANPTGEQDAPGVAAYATDEEVAARLWEVSLHMLQSAGWSLG